MPAWLSRTFESACGRWLVTATSLSCGGVDRDRARPERRDERVCRAVALGLGRGQRSEKPGRALEELGARASGSARLGPADRMAADEARVVPAAAQTAVLVEPASVTVQPAGAREYLVHDLRKRRHGDRDERDLGLAEGFLERAGGLDGFPLGATSSAARSSSQPVTCDLDRPPRGPQRRR